MRWHRSASIFGVTAIGIGTLFVPGVASARNPHPPSPPTLSEPIIDGLVGPLQLDVDGSNLYVAQSFAGVLTKITADGSTDLASVPGGEISGVTAQGDDVVYTAGDGTLPANQLTWLRNGTSTVIVNTLDYEQAHNPDAGETYGLTEPLSDDCAAQWPAEQLGPPTYTGVVDSHAYALAHSDHELYIADAGSNDILGIGREGELRTVAVLPPQPTVITAEAAAANGIPDCAVGLTYNFEAVPTDVEIGRDGKLYVTTLPGGPEDPSLGARGSVYRIDPSNGRVRRLATGFLGATNLALGPKGEIYVAELFGGKVSQVVHGALRTVVELPAPAGLEYAYGRLVVAYDVFPPDDGPPNGKIATISLTS